MFVYLDTSRMQRIIYRPDLHTLRPEGKKSKQLLVVANEVSVNIKTKKIPSNMITLQVTYYVWKIHNFTDHWSIKKD